MHLKTTLEGFIKAGVRCRIVHFTVLLARLRRATGPGGTGSSGGGFDFWVRGQNDHRGEGELSISTENCG